MKLVDISDNYLVLALYSHEEWLLKNKKAMGMVINGLKDAKEGRVREINYRKI